MKDDVQRIVDIVQRVAPLQATALAAVDGALRAELAGSRLRIQPRPPITIEQINAGLYAGLSVRDVAKQMGCSRHAIYRRLRPRGKSQPAK